MRPLLPRSAVSLLLTATLTLLAACGNSTAPAHQLHAENASSDSAGTFTVLSNRPDLISGGDALVEFANREGSSAQPRLTLNGHDVSAVFAPVGSGRYWGLVTGLAQGANTLEAANGGQASRITLINHGSGGPVFSGPQVPHWQCQQGALDTQCNQAPVYRWYYKSTSPAKPTLQSYDPASPPSDVASTTTDQGTTVPFIVREETGYIARDQYKIAVLFQPGQPWSAAAPQPQFNHKVLVTHGYGCGVAYAAGDAPEVITYQPLNLQASTNGAVPFTPDGVVPDTGVRALGAGFAVISTALDNSGHHCDVASQAESLVMLKERVIEQLGTLRYTIGIGCSGGSLAQQWIANAYPGVYQGVLLACSFPDAWSSATQVLDYHLLNLYFGTATVGVGGKASLPWTPLQVAAVEGSITPVNSITSDSGFFNVIEPATACKGTTADTVYNAVGRPDGVRCSIADLAINVFAPRPPQVWSASEKTLGRGFAGLAVDNVGVQYGLQALQQSLITPAMFLDLNEKIGGIDIDANATPQRLVADPAALANAYRSGMINTASHYDQTAIIDCRGPDPGASHDAYRSFALRARLDAAHGGHANQLIWEGPYPLGADTACQNNAFVAIDRWLAAVEADTRAVALPKKIVDDRPADLGDACYNGTGIKLSDGLCGDVLVSIYATPRMVAGDAITTLTSKCQLKPLNRTDNYGPTAFTDAEWQRMLALFEDGVCDFSKPGVSVQPGIPWLIYQNADGSVIYGGSTLPVAPVGSGRGWASASFGVGWPSS